MPAYLDHAASTPMQPEALAAMVEELAASGNASSLHASGRRSRRVVEEAREQVASALGARPSEVILTAGGTESDNLAVIGIARARRAADPRRVRVAVSAVEHAAVLDAAGALRGEGFLVTLLGVDAVGRVELGSLEAWLADGPDTAAVVSVMWANNEVGTVAPIAALAQRCRAAGVPMHTDAVQAVGQLPVDFAVCGVDALSVSGHKIGAAHGSGALLLRSGTACAPLSFGGGQERDLRSGTVDTASAVALGVAAQLAVARQPETARRLGALRLELVQRVLAEVPSARLYGDHAWLRGGGLDTALPGLACVAFAGCEGDSLLMLLDARGVECSTGAACSAGVARPSHVLLAMGADAGQARSSLRFSLGHTSTEADVDALVGAIAPVVERAERAGALAQARRRSTPVAAR